MELKFLKKTTGGGDLLNENVLRPIVHFQTRWLLFIINRTKIV